MRRARRPHGPPVKRYAVIVFALTAALVTVVAVTLDRNARRSNWAQTETALAGSARVAAASMSTLRSNLRVDASQLATSLPLQRAVVTEDRPTLDRIAAAHHAQLMLLDGSSAGTLAPQPRIASTASITAGAHVIARVTIALPLGNDILTLIRQTTPLPTHAALLFARDGRVIAGGTIGAGAAIVHGRATIGGTQFAARATPLGVARVSVVAVEPVSAVDAESQSFRRFVLLAAIATLALMGALATRLARPLAQVMADLGHLTRQAQTDSLTGLANRRSLDERLELELVRADAQGTSVSYVMIDLDDFKEINDEHGHQSGDEILRAVAQAVRGAIRELDLAARYGGEELAVVLPGSRLDDARRTAERMRRAVEEIELASPGGEPMRVTASFGVAEFPTYPSVEAVVGAADAALYQAKRNGKNQVATATVQGDGDGPSTKPRLAPAS